MFGLASNHVRVRLRDRSIYRARADATTRRGARSIGALDKGRSVSRLCGTHRTKRTLLFDNFVRSKAQKPIPEGSWPARGIKRSGILQNRIKAGYQRS